MLGALCSGRGRLRLDLRDLFIEIQRPKSPLQLCEQIGLRGPGQCSKLLLSQVKGE